MASIILGGHDGSESFPSLRIERTEIPRVAGEVAKFLLGEAKHGRKVYCLVETGRLAAPPECRLAIESLCDACERRRAA